MTPRPWTLRGALWIPALVAAAVYANTIGNYFVLDDFHFVLENPAVIDGVSFPLLEGNRTSSGTVFYRPLGILLYSIEYSLFGPSTIALHLTSLVCHVVATSLVVLVVSRLARPRVALIAGLLFAVHPVHVEAVASVANRTEILAAIFWLAAVFVHLRLGQERWRLSAAIGSALALLAMLSKESAVTLPLAIAAIDWLRPSGPASGWERARGALGVLPGIAIYFALRHAAGVENLVYHDYFYAEPLGVRALTTGAVMARYAELLIAPRRLLADYSDPTIALAHGLRPTVVIGFAAGAAVIAGIAAGARRKNLVSLGLALGAIGMAPYLHVLPVTVIMAERFLYLPSVGFCLAAAVGLDRLWARLDPAWLGAAALAAVTLSLALLAVNRNADYRDPIRLWRADVATEGRNPYAHAQLGLSLYQFGGPAARAEAIAELGLAVEMAPQRPEYRVALAAIHYREGRLNDARRVLLGGALTPEARRLLEQIDAALPRKRGRAKMAR